jgi:hypothetical protein
MGDKGGTELIDMEISSTEPVEVAPRPTVPETASRTGLGCDDPASIYPSRLNDDDTSDAWSQT